VNELTAKFWPFVKVLFLPYVVFLFLLLFPMEYYVTAPGGLAEVSKTIQISYQEDKVITGSFSTTYVMAINRPSFFEFIVSYFSRYTDSGPLTGSNSSYTNEEITRISYLDKSTSVDAAVIVAYEAIAVLNPEIHIVYDIRTLVFGKAEYLSFYDTIEFGDEFLFMTGDHGILAFPVNESKPSDCVSSDTDADGITDDFCSTAEAIAYSSIDADTYDFTFKNAAGDEYIVALTKDAETHKFGITLKVYYLVNDETTPAFTELPSNIGGPSGGLLQTLYIYNMLSAEDITHGLKIAGTGTIQYDGSVGYIGGVKQKIATAYLFGVDVFFMPHLAEVSYDNYVEALAACEELGIDPEGWLVPVASLQDALDYLSGLED
jgi:PDZ domain-containing protein